MSYITIDGKSYFSPCSNCFDKNCWSCILTKYEKDIKIKESELYSANFKIRTELEPRIKAERDSYDRWVSEDTGAQACESFLGLIDNLIDFVEGTDKYVGRKDVFCVHARIGGNNWNYYGGYKLEKEPWFLERVDDYWDSTYCDIYVKIDKEIEEDV